MRKRCRICGCTELNCSQCVERTGRPCEWAASDLCTACVDVAAVIEVAVAAKEHGYDDEAAYYRLCRAVERLQLRRPEAIHG